MSQCFAKNLIMIKSGFSSPPFFFTFSHTARLVSHLSVAVFQCGTVCGRVALHDGVFAGRVVDQGICSNIESIPAFSSNKEKDSKFMSTISIVVSPHCCSCKLWTNASDHCCLFHVECSFLLFAERPRAVGERGSRGARDAGE
jgi:hypothetical protein